MSDQRTPEDRDTMAEAASKKAMSMSDNTRDIGVFVTLYAILDSAAAADGGDPAAAAHQIAGAALQWAMQVFRDTDQTPEPLLRAMQRAGAKAGVPIVPAAFAIVSPPPDDDGVVH